MAIRVNGLGMSTRMAGTEFAGTESCPHCGQPLLTERAARRLRESELDQERRIVATARTIATKLARERSDRTAAVGGLGDGAFGPDDAATASDLRARRLVLGQL